MSFVITYPEALAAAAGHLNCVGSVLAAQNVAAAAATTGLPPAAADEVPGAGAGDNGDIRRLAAAESCLEP